MKLLIAALVATFGLQFAHGFDGLESLYEAPPAEAMKAKGNHRPGGMLVKMYRVCRATKLSKDQKSEIAAVVKASRTQFMQAGKDVLKARRLHQETLMDPTKTEQDADAAAAILGRYMKTFLTLRKDVAYDILFDILQPEQRKPFMMCHQLKKRMAMMFRRGPKPPHHGAGQGPGPHHPPHHKPGKPGPHHPPQP